mgnify:CR=1 FL=1
MQIKKESSASKATRPLATPVKCQADFPFLLSDFVRIVQQFAAASQSPSKSQSSSSSKKTPSLLHTPLATPKTFTMANLAELRPSLSAARSSAGSASSSSSGYASSSASSAKTQSRTRGSDVGSIARDLSLTPDLNGSAIKVKQEPIAMDETDDNEPASLKRHMSDTSRFLGFDLSQAEAKIGSGSPDKVRVSLQAFRLFLLWTALLWLTAIVCDFATWQAHCILAFCRVVKRSRCSSANAKKGSLVLFCSDCLDYAQHVRLLFFCQR